MFLLNVCTYLRNLMDLRNIAYGISYLQTAARRLRYLCYNHKFSPPSTMSTAKKKQKYFVNLQHGKLIILVRQTSQSIQIKTPPFLRLTKQLRNT